MISISKQEIEDLKDELWLAIGEERRKEYYRIARIINDLPEKLEVT